MHDTEKWQATATRRRGITAATIAKSVAKLLAISLILLYLCGLISHSVFAHSFEYFSMYLKMIHKLYT